MTNSHPLRASLCSLAILALAATPGCTDKKDPSAPTADAKKDTPETPPKPKADDGGDAAPSGEGGKDEHGIADTVAEAIPVAKAAADKALPDRGPTLGWMIARNVEGTLASAKTQLIPSKYASFGDIATLKAAAGALGPEATVVQKLNFAEPMGCALVDDTVAEVPVACFFSYEGGAAAVSADVAQGKQGDAKGHVAYHVLEGQDLFVDDAGAMVVVTTHADLFAKSKAYLTDTLVPHAKKQRDDMSFVVFADAAIARYEPLLSGFLGSAGPSGAAALGLYKDIETFQYGLSLSPEGFHFRMGVGAKPGSDYDALVKKVWAGPVAEKWFTKVPSTAWVLATYNAHLSELRGNKTMDMMTPVYDMAVDGYARETGKDAKTVRAALSGYLDEMVELYGSAGAFAMLHESGTMGAAVLIVEKANDGRAKWKAWTETFAAKDIIPADGLKDVDWTFKTDAATVDGIAVDRWTVHIKKIADPEVKAIAARFGGKLDVTIDRLEFDDSVAFVVALSDIDKADAAVVAASKGTKTIKDAAGGPAVIAKGTASISVLAADAKRMFAWLGEAAPEGAPYPGVGVDLMDVTFTTTGGASNYEMDALIGQAFIDQLKALIP
ncbi:MAG: hypothetical protein AAF721_27460 [Myxococcota bacterium]